jgi:hypothetical protein
VVESAVMLKEIFSDYIVPLFFAIGVIVCFAKIYDKIHSRYMEYRGRKLWEKIDEEEKGVRRR